MNMKSLVIAAVTTAVLGVAAIGMQTAAAPAAHSTSRVNADFGWDSVTAPSGAPSTPAAS